MRLYVYSVTNATRESPDRAEWKCLTQGADSAVYNIAEVLEQRRKWSCCGKRRMARRWLLLASVLASMSSGGNGESTGLVQGIM